MDNFMVDVSEIDDVKVGEQVILWEGNEIETIAEEDVSASAGLLEGLSAVGEESGVLEFPSEAGVSPADNVDEFSDVIDDEADGSIDVVSEAVSDPSSELILSSAEGLASSGVGVPASVSLCGAPDSAEDDALVSPICSSSSANVPASAAYRMV